VVPTPLPSAIANFSTMVTVGFQAQRSVCLISKYLFQGAGFLVAAQAFLTFAITGDHWGGKLAHAAEYAMLPIPLLVIGALATSGNGLRAAGFTILLRAGGGAVAFFSAVCGDPSRDRIPLVQAPRRAN